MPNPPKQVRFQEVVKPVEIYANTELDINDMNPFVDNIVKNVFDCEVDSEVDTEIDCEIDCEVDCEISENIEFEEKAMSPINKRRSRKRGGWRIRVKREKLEKLKKLEKQKQSEQKSEVWQQQRKYRR
jgi:hypothetical protein